MSSASDALKPPATPPQTKHQLRRRSPVGQRGRPRKTPSAPPRQLKDQVRQLRRSPYFLPGLLAIAALVLALLYSAVRIASRQSDLDSVGTVVNAPLRPAPKGPVPDKERGKVELLKKDQPNRLASDQVAGFKAKDPLSEEALDDAVRHALEEAWHLPPPGQHVGDAAFEASKEREAAGEVAVDAQEGAGEKPPLRTLAELYADLEELGISPNELSEALNGAWDDAR
ncbi:hypothetical protein JCM8097_004255 [Rhodosporidiobolus ruineniae]